MGRRICFLFYVPPRKREFSPVFFMFKQLFCCRKCFEFKKPYTPYFMQFRIVCFIFIFFLMVGLMIKLITVQSNSTFLTINLYLS